MKTSVLKREFMLKKKNESEVFGVARVSKAKAED